MQSWMLPTSVRNIFRNYFDKEKNFYDNHQTLLDKNIYVLHRQELQFLNEIREELRKDNIDLDITCFWSQMPNGAICPTI